MTKAETIKYAISKECSRFSLIDWCEECGFTLDEFEEFLDNGVKKSNTGHWVKVGGYATPGGDPVWRCSECGKGIHVYGIEHGTYGEDVADGQWVSCPNCSAIMIDEVKHL